MTPSFPAFAPDTAVVIVDHGSKREEANRMLCDVAALFKARSGLAIVEPAHMELAPPSIGEAIDRCVEQGAKRIGISQFFLSPGRHSTQDIPQLVREAQERHPGVAIEVAEPLGVAAPVVDVLISRVASALGVRA